MVVLEGWVSGLNHGESVLLRRNLENGVIKVRNAWSPCHRDMPTPLKKIEHILVLDTHFTNCDVVEVVRSRAGCQEI